ncbi:conserved hypothetical protein [Aspergillus fumigatus A1163]|uniref:Glyoxalase family protein n=1 Tax=Aspergillus fumigatus (strain CBS 144.89 / FGSC A1163 / CEA10) TaxID=451804 RepID=B0Y1B3_ASPFC|nr:conserved hypothetical protein [Aspergillus fumigatus A1163]
MSSTIDHVGIHAPKDQFESIIDWYKKALAPLNYREIMRFPGAVGLGSEHPDFWISETDEQCGGFHFAFIAHGCYSSWRKVQWRSWNSSRVSSTVLWGICVGSTGQQCGSGWSSIHR